MHYYAIAEAGEGGSWWISFPGRDGIVSAADDARQIVPQAQDALESAAMHGRRLPRSIEDGATPPTDLSDFQAPSMVVVIPFEPAAAEAAGWWKTISVRPGVGSGSSSGKSSGLKL
jgi:predicted RNase H-like HicB family nuclease